MTPTERDRVAGPEEVGPATRVGHQFANGEVLTDEREST